MGRISAIFKRFPRTFWVANTLELFERWAWYGFFMLFANYLTGSSDMGGLELTQVQKGWIMGVGTGILYFLPVITGAIADKYGYRRVLFIAFLIYTSAFIFLPMFNTFAGVFFIYLYLALGAALFKPIVSATVAKTTDEKTSSIGFGIFYMMVNFGAFIGPMLTLLYKNSSYDMVFRISAGIIALNFILLLFYKEPDRTKSSEPFIDTITHILKNIAFVMKDLRFVLFLVIVAGFWTMYMQLFFTLPVFITQWVDTSGLYHFFKENIPFIAQHYGVNNQIEAEFITNLDALYIILLQVIVSSLVMRWRALSTMVVGIVISSIGMALTMMTQNVIFIIVALLVFAVGEMTASPKITEYIGRIAPPGKKALYMGYSFIPVFLGNIFGGFISGNVYELMSDKYTFLLGEVSKRNLVLPAGLSKNEFFDQAAGKMNLSHEELTDYLWQNYHPYHIWFVLLGIGLVAAFCLWLYNRYSVKKGLS